jgi:hypothetical protein
MLPTIRLGPHELTRLIIGGNPFSGNSHQSAQLDAEMEDFFTTARIKETLFRCMEVGINAMQLRADKHIMRVIREFRLEGGNMHWIAQTASEFSPFEGNVRRICEYKASAVYHHGTVTDALFKEGAIEELVRRLRVLRATGLPVGLGTHMPEVIAYAEEQGWDLDFYLASVHNLSKINRVSKEVTGVINKGEPFDDEDRTVMYGAIRATAKPCLVIKVLSAGRKCASIASVRAAFAEALANIKPTDAIVVGMYPKHKDQVAENARLVREILGA